MTCVLPEHQFAIIAAPPDKPWAFDSAVDGADALHAQFHAAWRYAGEAKARGAAAAAVVRKVGDYVTVWDTEEISEGRVRRLGDFMAVSARPVMTSTIDQDKIHELALSLVPALAMQPAASEAVARRAFEVAQAFFAETERRKKQP